MPHTFLILAHYLTGHGARMLPEVFLLVRRKSEDAGDLIAVFDDYERAEQVAEMCRKQPAMADHLLEEKLLLYVTPTGLRVDVGT